MLKVFKEGKTEYTKQTITQVRKAIREKGEWKGLIAPNKVNAFHLEGGWHLGYRRGFTSLDELDSVVNSMLFYLDREIGDRVAFYLVKDVELT